jgi:hypothetical protein
MYLLSEMHIRVYNARHIKREAAVIFFSADDAGVSHAEADGKKSQASASFAEFPVLPRLRIRGALTSHPHTSCMCEIENL